MMNKLGTKFIKEIGMHELVIIGDVKTNDTFALERFRKLSLQPIRMRSFHAKNDIGPTQMPFRDHDPGVGLRADGANLIVR